MVLCTIRPMMHLPGGTSSFHSSVPPGRYLMVSSLEVPPHYIRRYLQGGYLCGYPGYPVVHSYTFINHGGILTYSMNTFIEYL